MKKIFFTAICLIMSVYGLADDLTQSVQTTGNISIKIVGISDVEGKLFVGVGETDNPRQMRGGVIDVSDYEITIEIGDVAYGSTSINVFQDLNGNNQLDFGDFGKPLEPCTTESIIFDKGNKYFEIELKRY